MAHILMVGLGKLGTPLSEKWLAAGHQVSAVRRRQEAPEGVDVYAQDIVAVDEISLPSKPVDLVYIIVTPAERSEAAYQQAFLQLPEKMLTAIQQQSLMPPVIFVSSTAVYGASDQPVNEDSPTIPNAFNGRILLEAEKQIHRFASGTCVRFSGIYGASLGTRVALAEKLLAGHDARLPEARWSSRIHRDDAVQILFHLGQRWLANDAPPAVVVGTDKEPVVNLALLNWLAEQLGGKLDLAWPQVAGRAVHSRYLEAVDYEFIYPSFRHGYAALLRQR